ncbi:MAG: TonB-dependent receptor [Mariniphaga sp.]|nr:TonB-dependent receptor [Mariniphaga sp.]
MKRVILLLLVLLLCTPSFSQKKRDKVKRKYRSVESVNRDLPEIYLWGKVMDEDDVLLPGASVILPGTRLGVHANSDGEYLLTGLSSGRQRIEASFIGYKSKYIDIVLQDGPNELYFTLDEEAVNLDPIVVSSQKREQQILDVPSTISVIDNKTIGRLDIKELNHLSDFIPGLNVRIQNTLRPSYVIRGLTSDEVSPNAQPRVSVFYNNIPISRGSGSITELYDMERVEVHKGPQGTLFGRGAQIGAIHFLSKKPTNIGEGYASARYGDFGQKGAEGAVNIPILENKLMVRAAGSYNFRDGYVNNTFGGTLNGLNTIAGRFSLRFIPSVFTRFDLEVNYQKDDAPGTAFMSKMFPNTNGITDVFGYEASLDKGEDLKTQKDVLTTILNARHYLTEHNYITSITSYRTNTAYAMWDGDGTAAEAINMSEDNKANQFTQELRYNFSRNSKLNGFIGASYWRENASQDYWFGPNEQHMFHLFFDPNNLVMPNGQPITVPALPPIPELGSLGGMPLPINHKEINKAEALNQSYEAFADATYNLTWWLRVTAGVRIIYDRFKLNSETPLLESTPSTLGMLTGNYPNLFFKPSEKKEIKDNSMALTYRAGLNIKLTENANIYWNYSKGRRPKVLQFSSNGESETLAAEIVDNFEMGFKGIFWSRLWTDIGIYYFNYADFQTSAWIADPSTGEFNYLIKDGGKATAYGVEATLKYAINKNIEIFGNYAYSHARFDSIDHNGNEQLYAGNSFRLTPDHSFGVGLNLTAAIGETMKFFLLPTYSFKSQFYFEDANTEGLEQDAYGLLNLQTGLKFNDPNITFSVYANNLLGEKYLISAGNTGSLFGVPTFIPGAPRMIGTKLTWNFTMEKKPYYQRRRK